MEEHLKNNPDLLRLIESGDKAGIEKYLSGQPNLVAGMLKSISRMDEPPSERLHGDAIDKFYDENDYVGAIDLLNEALTFKNANKGALYSFRSDCHIKLLNYIDALNDINKAIQTLDSKNSDDYFYLYDYLEKRAKVKVLLHDPGAEQDIVLASKYKKLDREINPGTYE